MSNSIFFIIQLSSVYSLFSHVNLLPTNSVLPPVVKILTLNNQKNNVNKYVSIHEEVVSSVGKVSSHKGVRSNDVVIASNVAPNVGSLKANILSGIALKTEFTLNASDFGGDLRNELPFRFVFGYRDKNFEKYYLKLPSFENYAIVKLPSGISQNNFQLIVFVEVSDSFGSKSEASLSVIVVPPTFINGLFLENVKISIENAVMYNLSYALGNIVSTLSTLSSFEKEVVEVSLKKTEELMTVSHINDFKESFIKVVFKLATQKQDVESEKVIIHSIRKITSSSFWFGASCKYQAKLCMLIRQETDIAFKHFRRRRATTVSANVTTSLEKIQYTLESFENISSNNFTSSDRKLKKIFTDITNNLVVSMCKNAVFGQPLLLAQSKLIKLEAVKLYFNKTDILSCAFDCIKPIYAVWMYINMMNLEWDCGTANCSGLCLGYAEYTSDYYSITNQDFASKIVSFVLINPTNNAYVSTILLPMQVRVFIPLTIDLCQDCIYNCLTFFTRIGSWSDMYCTSSQQIKVLNGSFFIPCDCFTLGIHSAVSMQGARLEPSIFANVQIKFSNNYAATLARVSKASLESSLKFSIVSLMRIEFWRVRNMVCSNGSIISSFQLLPSDNPTWPLNDDLQRLSNYVSQGDLSVTLIDGFQLTLNTTYFSYDMSVVTNADSDEEHPHSELGIIIAGGIVGGLGFLIIIVYLFKKFKILSLLRNV